MPTMVRTAQDGGDGGKANVADVLWRVAQKNPDHARFFQRELSTALGGETIPIRQALMHGEVSPAQLVDPAKSPGLLGTAKPNRFADPDFEKSYWQSAEAYKAEFAQRQQTPPATEEPRQIDPGRRGAISTNPENPATPDRGNFADKLWERQSESQDRQVPDLSADQKATRDTLLKVRTQGKNLGYENSSRMLDHYLNGNGDPVTLDKDLVRQHPPVQDGEAKSQKHFEDWLVGKGPDDNSFGKIWDHLPKGDGTVTIKGMQWDGAVDNPSWRELDDKSNTLGALTVKGEGDLKLERKGNDVFVTGTVNQHAEDKYDFGKNGRDNEWLPQGILGGDFTMTRQQITDMEMAGGAKAFEINTDRWTKVLEGRLKLDDQGNIIGSQFVWKEVPSSDKMRR
ncbi:MAG: hypothetical protein OEL53_13285 [Rhodospirillales bacterium]|nr:hypothetical protein [Rhodospirillales bacterium]